jgi:hypothetical protein
MVNIRIYDRPSRLIHSVYLADENQKHSVQSEPLGDKGFGPHVLRTRETLLINEGIEKKVAEFGSHALVPGPMAKSQVMVPLVVGAEAHGLLALYNMKREHAFSDSDVRLLQTLAGSMSVALENARLFDETQRLYKESEQRAAELAVVNTVQQSLAAELNIQGIYEAVGSKIGEIFSRKDLNIRVLDPETGLLHYPYAFEGGKRLEVTPHAATRAFPSTCFAPARRSSSTRTSRAPRRSSGPTAWPAARPRSPRSSCRSSPPARSAASST